MQWPNKLSEEICNEIPTVEVRLTEKDKRVSYQYLWTILVGDTVKVMLWKCWINSLVLKIQSSNINREHDLQTQSSHLYQYNWVFLSSVLDKILPNLCSFCKTLVLRVVHELLYKILLLQHMMVLGVDIDDCNVLVYWNSSNFWIKWDKLKT